MPLNQVAYQPLPTQSLTPGVPLTQPTDHTGSSLVSEVHGKWYSAAKNGLVWHAQVTAVTLPVVASALASKFSIYNPAGSGKVLELISADVGLVLATTVVDVVGLYYESGSLLNPTSITYGTPVNGILGSSALPTARFCTAITHTTSTTPTRAIILATFGAVTTTADNPIHYDFEGKVLVNPGTLISVAMSTAASTTSGVDIGMSWIEWPL